MMLFREQDEQIPRAARRIIYTILWCWASLRDGFERLDQPDWSYRSSPANRIDASSMTGAVTSWRGPAIAPDELGSSETARRVSGIRSNRRSWRLRETIACRRRL